MIIVVFYLSFDSSRMTSVFKVDTHLNCVLSYPHIVHMSMFFLKYLKQSRGVIIKAIWVVLSFNSGEKVYWLLIL